MSDTAPRPVLGDTVAGSRSVELTVPDLDGVPEVDNAEPADADADVPDTGVAVNGG